VTRKDEGRQENVLACLLPLSLLLLCWNALLAAKSGAIALALRCARAGNVPSPAYCGRLRRCCLSLSGAGNTTVSLPYLYTHAFLPTTTMPTATPHYSLKAKHRRVCWFPGRARVYVYPQDRGRARSAAAATRAASLRARARCWAGDGGAARTCRLRLPTTALPADYAALPPTRTFAPHAYPTATCQLLRARCTCSAANAFSLLAYGIAQAGRVPGLRACAWFASKTLLTAFSAISLAAGSLGTGDT